MGDMRTCFYCGAIVTGKGIGDHFPIPFSHGGTETVDCCQSCHDMKDRVGLGNWSTTWISVIVSDFPNLRRETKLFLAKAIKILYQMLEPYQATSAGGDLQGPLPARKRGKKPTLDLPLQAVPPVAESFHSETLPIPPRQICRIKMGLSDVPENLSEDQKTELSAL